MLAASVAAAVLAASCFVLVRQLGDDASLFWILLLGWIGVTLIAALVGNAIAKRTLAPVLAAADAAGSMAQRLLGTRAPMPPDDEFEAWAASFNEMATALENKIRALQEAHARERRFTSDVAHELRTPLSALVSAASLLEDRLDEMPVGARRPAELIVADIGRLRRLVQDLLELARLDAGQESVDMEPVEIGPAVAAVIHAYGWEADVDLQFDTVTVLADQRRLERIIANLVGNALRHGAIDVSIRVRAMQGHAVVEISDRGPGIAAENLPHVFERFYKADPARTIDGSGLGLSIALENAKLLGGTIAAWSQPGSGACFTIRLPLIRPDA